VFRPDIATLKPAGGVDRAGLALMWLAPRMDQNDTTLQTTFGLPPHEVLIENFSCAVKRRILLHGRMFISAEHVCFRSDIFGLKTNIVIPMRDIVTIRRVRLVFSRARKGPLPLARPDVSCCTAGAR